MPNDSFWKDFLRPLTKKEKPESYGSSTTEWLRRKPELTLEKNLKAGTRCLSSMILRQLQVQTEQNERGKKRKADECSQELASLVKVVDSDSQSREGSSQDGQRQLTTSKSLVHIGGSVSALDKVRRESVNHKRTINDYFKADDEAKMELSDEEITGPNDEGSNVMKTLNVEVYNKREENDVGKFKNEQLSLSDAVVLRAPERFDDVTKNVETRIKHEEDDDNEEESQLDQEQIENVRKVMNIAKERDKIDKQKSHQHSCVSKWNLTYLNLYVAREQVSLVETLSDEAVKHFDEISFSKLRNSITDRSRQILSDSHNFSSDDENGLRLWSFQFSDPMVNEMTVSLMVFEVLNAVCKLCGVRLKPEQALEKNQFPNARVDYALAYKEVVFGVVEVKTPRTMTPAALAQLLLPLLKLQNESCQETMQYIGILTDGFRYVIVQLEGEKFTFEKEVKALRPELHIRRAVKWNDLSQLCGDMQSVFTRATEKLEQLTKK